MKNPPLSDTSKYHSGKPRCCLNNTGDVAELFSQCCFVPTLVTVCTCNNNQGLFSREMQKSVFLQNEVSAGVSLFMHI